MYLYVYAISELYNASALQACISLIYLSLSGKSTYKVADAHDKPTYESKFTGLLSSAGSPLAS